MQVLRVGGDGAAVEPAAQQHADRHIRAQMHLHRIAQRGVECLDGGFERREIRRGVEVRNASNAAAPWHRRRWRDQREMACRRGACGCAGNACAAAGARATRRSRESASGIAFARHPRQREQALQLRGKGEASAVREVIERLLPEVIAREEQAVCVFVSSSAKANMPRSCANIASP